MLQLLSKQHAGTQFMAHGEVHVEFWATASVPTSEVERIFSLMHSVTSVVSALLMNDKFSLNSLACLLFVRSSPPCIHRTQQL